MANVYLGEGRFQTEKHDCSVIALSYAFEIDYTKAHEICKKAGRKDKDGFDLRQAIGYGERTNHSGLYHGFFYLNKFVQLYTKPQMTVGSFKFLYPKGIYIIRVGGHIFTMKNGVVYNQSNMKARIGWYYKITERLI